MVINHDAEEMELMINDCLNRPNQLSGWEHDFMHSIYSLIEENKPLTQSQLLCLDRIWERVTSR